MKCLCGARQSRPAQPEPSGNRPKSAEVRLIRSARQLLEPRPVHPGRLVQRLAAGDQFERRPPVVLQDVSCCRG